MKLYKHVLLILSVIFFNNAIAKSGPKFSWDNVPVYSHFGATGGMTDEEIAFIAKHYDFITLEKGHGGKLHGGVSEPQTFIDAAKIKAINPDARILFYWNMLLDYPMYQMSKQRKSSDDWFIHTVDGKLHTKGKMALKRYDLSNTDWQNWWVNAAKEALDKSNMDGVFIDAIPQIGLKADARIKEWGEEKFNAIENGINQTLAKLQKALSADKTIIYNGIRSIPNGWQHGGNKYLAHTSGNIIEHFNVFQSQAPQQIAQDLEGMMQASKAGKITILKTWPGFTWLDKEMLKRPKAELQKIAREKITFPLAAFLIAAGEKSYFNYTWGYRENHGAYDWYPEFDKKLGAPLSDAVQEGFEYTREFKHASVYLNIKDKTAKIDWH